MRTRPQVVTALVLLVLFASPVGGRVDEAAPIVAPIVVSDRGASVGPRVTGHRPDVGLLSMPKIVARRPRVPLPANPPVVRLVGGGKQQSRRGVASWYCGHGSRCTAGYPEGLFAAAGPALRVGDWRGRFVVVHAAGRSVRVRLIDWCQCGGGDRLIDLYSEVWDRLRVPLSRGLLNVTVSW